MAGKQAVRELIEILLALTQKLCVMAPDCQGFYGAAPSCSIERQPNPPSPQRDSTLRVPAIATARDTHDDTIAFPRGACCRHEFQNAGPVRTGPPPPGATDCVRRNECAPLTTHSRLYRRSLKLALDWAVHRYLWRGQAMYIRSLFEANKNVTEPRRQRVR